MTKLVEICLDTVGKYPDAETFIRDHQGWMHDGYYCNCDACPYWVTSTDERMACYGDMYHECKNSD